MRTRIIKIVNQRAIREAKQSIRDDFVALIKRGGEEGGINNLMQKIAMAHRPIHLKYRPCKLDPGHILYQDLNSIPDHTVKRSLALSYENYLREVLLLRNENELKKFHKKIHRLLRIDDGSPSHMIWTEEGQLLTEKREIEKAITEKYPNSLARGPRLSRL